ncbi:hypothetical protein R3P38DRAFT_2890572 [Favolaschia claudopus]|uniref:F-box domain-containing protein n=1 Tax=Favolaschia claudopus TaxID=2862362 RepID=A0AAW0CUW6_9AGAR
MTGLLSLPTELLVEIVNAARDHRRHGDFPPSQFFYPKLEPELRFCHISRRLRNVVLGAPSLWTYTEVDVWHPGSVEFFKMHLELSRNCNLWIIIRELSWDKITVESQQITEALNHVVPHVSRIQGLAIMSNPTSMDAVLAPFRFLEAPRLQYLQIDGGDGVSEDVHACMDIFQLGAPRITSFNARGFTPQPPLPQWAASLRRLEMWRWEEDGNDDGGCVLARIVPSCSNSLVHLHLDMLTMRHGLIPAGSFRIPTLKTLRLLMDPDADGADDLFSALRLFDVPAVLDLTIIFAHGQHICALFNDPDSLRGTTFPSLNSLSFLSQGCHCDSQADADRLRHTSIAAPPTRLFPALTCLKLVGGCFTAPIIADILCPSPHQWPLRELAVSLSNTVEWELSQTEEPTTPRAQANLDLLQAIYSSLQRIIISRRQRGQSLPSFKLSPQLFHQDYWDDNAVQVEMFYPPESLEA